MLRNGLRIRKSDGKHGADQPEIALSWRGEANGHDVSNRIAALMQGCSLLYPHCKLVVDLVRVPARPELEAAIDRMRSQIEMRGGSVHVSLPKIRASY
ncbi:MAG: hypothetical protein IT367_20010 [Candidatus Hydrogenedentes bacterium]|nr:hypothetical protein [Candidatus Hydrogenedentota bacterium]